MRQADFGKLQDTGTINALKGYVVGQESPATRRAWSQVRQVAVPLKHVDLSTADEACETCNATGVVRHTKIGGEQFTIICNCVTWPGEATP